MKIYLISVLLLIATTFSFGQTASVVERNEKWGDGSKPCLMIDLGITTTDNVEKALEQTMKDKGFKGATKKGFLTYTQITFPAIAPGMMDIYFKAIKTGKDHASLQMFLSKGYDNFMSSTSDNAAMENAKTFLQNFTVELKKYELGLAIADQKDRVEKAEKENEKLQKWQRDMEKDRDDLNKKLDQNKKDQENKVKELANLNDVLKELNKQLNDLK